MPKQNLRCVEPALAQPSKTLTYNLSQSLSKTYIVGNPNRQSQTGLTGRSSEAQQNFDLKSQSMPKQNLRCNENEKGNEDKKIGGELY